MSIRVKMEYKPASLFYPDKLRLIKQGLCPRCKDPINIFRDELSIKEYHISGVHLLKSLVVSGRQL